MAGMKWVVLLLASAVCQATEGVVTINVTGINQGPISNVQFSPAGLGSPSSLSGNDGRCVMQLPSSTKPGDAVTLNILGPRDKYVIIFPQNRTFPVPSWEDRPANYVQVVLARVGDKAVLQDGRAVMAMVVTVLSEGSPAPTRDAKTTPDKKPADVLNEALKKVAKKFGLEAADVDAAIRAWKTRTDDPGARGLKELYEKRYTIASDLLSEALKNEERQLNERQKQVSRTAFFLGRSNYELKRYQDAEKAFRRAAELAPKDVDALDYLASTLELMGRHADAESVYKRELAAMKPEGDDSDDEDLGEAEPHDFYPVLFSLARVQEAQKNYARAEVNFRDGYDHYAEMLADDPNLSEFLEPLAEFLERRGRYGEAEWIYRQLFVAYHAAESPRIVFGYVEDVARIRKKQGKYDPTQVANSMAGELFDANGAEGKELATDFKAQLLALDAKEHK